VIVADSSALTKYLTREEGCTLIRRYLEEGCVTLELAFKEISNALRKRVTRGELDAEYAVKVLSVLAALEIIKVADQRKLLPDAFTLAVKRNVTVYDALFVALAKEAEAPLLTADKTQAKAGREEGVKVILV